MQTLRLVTLALALCAAAAGLPGCAVAQAPQPYYGGAVQGFPDAWEDDLAPYGGWQTIPQYGTVWYPNVAPTWRPYTYGYWGAGPSGWVWFSSEPWGFTFHYGRWAYAPIGWVWVPGTVWSPAWVNWYWGNGYVGWAPLGYYGALPWAQFVFVRDYDFGCRNINTVYRRPPYYGGGYHHGPPPRHHIERVTHQPIVRVSPSQLPHRVPPRGRGGVARPKPTGQRPDRVQGSAATPQDGGRVTTTPRVSGGTQPARPNGAPRPEPLPVRPQADGGPQRRYDVVVPRGSAPQGSPPRVHVPQVSPPQVSAPVAPPRQERSPYDGRAVPAEPQGTPRMAPQAPGMQLAPSVTGGGRGAAPSPGFRSQGMR
jgi:hypothetical protein